MPHAETLERVHVSGENENEEECLRVTVLTLTDGGRFFVRPFLLLPSSAAQRASARHCPGVECPGQCDRTQSLAHSLRLCPGDRGGVLASALTMDKIRTKQLLRSVDVPVPDDVFSDDLRGTDLSVGSNEFVLLQHLEFPEGEGSGKSLAEGHSCSSNLRSVLDGKRSELHSKK